MDYFKKNKIEIHLLDDGQLFNLLTRSNPISADLALRIKIGRNLKYQDAYTIKSKAVLNGNDNYNNLMAILKFYDDQNTCFPEDKIRDKIVMIANKKKGRPVEGHEVIVYLPYPYRTDDE